MYTCRKFKPQDTTNSSSKVKFIKSKGVSNKTYASEGGINIITGNPEINLTENDYSTVEENENQINEATSISHTKTTNSVGYDLSKQQMKTEEETKDYDHLEHLGLNKKLHVAHDASDTYAHAQAEENDNNDTYSHAQSGQHLCTPGQNELQDDTYGHAKSLGYEDSDTYDHSHLSSTEVKVESSDYAYAISQNTAVTEGDYDHAGCVD